MPVDPARAEAVFAAALARPAAERDPYLRAVCGDDPELRARVESLLRADHGLGSFLKPPTRPGATVQSCSPDVDGPSADAVSGEGAGTRIGRYKLVELIGEGGFGSVFLAEQEQPVKRRVAVKVIKPGMDTKQVIARFEGERQALALMDHPSIARVFDAGATDSGHPYVVMELVDGTPVTDYCDSHRLSTRERLELFVSVCNAVQHAHTKGVIHRDLKPSNVLVTLHDGRPVPKVIDFGIAKATQAPLTEKTPFTDSRHFLGTPAYMSPEQAVMGGLDVDTRSDVYSLGVLLYELLTGTTPFEARELRSKAYGEIQRMIREVDPPRPSTRVSTLGESLGAVAARRRSEPAKLSRTIRGELDWVVMRCLEKDRTRRYETADGLARDIGRYLRDEPVEASPPSAAYRLRKFVKRNRGRVAAAGLVLAALLAGMTGTTWGVIRTEHARRGAESARSAEAQRAVGERRAREEAQRRLAQVERATEILGSVFRDLDPIPVGNTTPTLRDLLCLRLADAAQQLEREPVGDPMTVARLLHVLGSSLRKLGEPKQAEAVLVTACQVRMGILGADHPDTTAARHDLALVYRSLGKYPAAEGLHKEVLAVRAATLGENHPDTLATRHHLAEVCQALQRFEEAEALLKEVLAARTAALGPTHPDTLTTRHRLAFAYRSLSKFAEAEATFKEVLAARTARLGTHHMDTIASRHGLASLYLSMQNYAESKTLYEEVVAARTPRLGSDHPDTLSSRHGLAAVYRNQGHHDLAQPLLEEVVKARTVSPGLTHLDTLRALFDLALVYGDQGKKEQAEDLLLGAYRAIKQEAGENLTDAQAIGIKAVLVRLVSFYDTWGAPDERAKWQAELDAVHAVHPPIR